MAMKISAIETNSFVLQRGEHLCSHMRASPSFSHIAFASQSSSLDTLTMNLFLRSTGEEKPAVGGERVRKPLINSDLKSVFDLRIDNNNEFWVVDGNKSRLLRISQDLHTIKQEMPCHPNTKIDICSETGQIVMADPEGLSFIENGRRVKGGRFPGEITKGFAENQIGFVKISNDGYIYMTTHGTYTIFKTTVSGHLDRVISEPRLSEDSKFVRFTPTIMDALCFVENGQYLLVAVTSERGLPEFGGFYLELLDKDLSRIDRLDNSHKLSVDTDGNRRICYLETNRAEEGGKRVKIALYEGEVSL